MSDVPEAAGVDAAAAAAAVAAGGGDCCRCGDDDGGKDADEDKNDDVMEVVLPLADAAVVVATQVDEVININVTIIFERLILLIISR